MFGCSSFQFPRLLMTAFRPRLAGLFILLFLGAAFPRPATAAAPDLIAKNITLAPKSVTLGGTSFTLALTIQNIGTATAAAHLTRIYASPDTEINGSGNDILIYTLAVPALAAGQSITFTSSTTPALWVNPDRVGASGNEYLRVGTYYIGLVVDSGNQVPGELNESNIFKSADKLTIGALPPLAPARFLPGHTTRNTSVIRKLEWTTATNANRYDVYMGRLKDSSQQFIKHSLLEQPTGVLKIYPTTLHGPAFANYGFSGYNLMDIPDLVVPEKNSLSLYYNYGDPYHPRFCPKLELLNFTTTGWTNTEGSNRMGYGTISSVCPANVNYFEWYDKYGVAARDWKMDLVVANYLSADPPNMGEGSVTLLLNLNTTDTMGENLGMLDMLPIVLKNDRNINGEKWINPQGIKSVVVGDFDGDTDNDVLAGCDRLDYGYDNDKIVMYQSDMRNCDQDNPTYVRSTKSPSMRTLLPTFKPVHLGFHDTPEDVQDMAVGDFDRDSRQDVALVSFFANKIYILHNQTPKDGDGRSTRTVKFTLSTPLFTDDAMTTTVFRGAYSVATCDFDGDRKTDIVAAAYFDGKVVVYENQVTTASISNFIPHVLTTELPNIEKVKPADMNGDGLMDIVAGSATEDKLVYFQNMGNFQFVERLVSTNANRVGDIGVFDLNFDLLPDIINVSYYDNNITWWTNYPTLTSKNLAATNLVQAHYKPPVQMDFNTTYLWKVTSKAGNTYSTTSKTMAFRTQPTRIHISPTLVNTMIEPTAGAAIDMKVMTQGPQSVFNFNIWAYVDPILDRPFMLDNLYEPTDPMFELGRFDYNLSYPPGVGGPLSVNFDATTVPEGLYNVFIAADGSTWGGRDGVRDGVFDGVPDGFDTNAYVTLMGNRVDPFSNFTYGDDVYQTSTSLGIVRKPGVPSGPSPKNMAIDIPTATPFSWTFSKYAHGYDFHMAKAAATAPTYTSVTLAGTATQAKSLDAGDLNGDGLPDVVCSYVRNNLGVIDWYKNGALGRGFRSSQIIANLPAAPLLQIVDMDRDGKKDVLASSTANAQIWWYKNKGGDPLVFNMSPTVVASSVYGITSIRGVDLDGSGTMDVLAASTGDKRLCWFDRAGTKYTLRVIDATSGIPNSAIAADVDRDGDLDVVASFWSPNSLAWYENAGGSPPNFVRHAFSTSIQEPRGLASGDLDGDGDLDLACVSGKEGKLYWFSNNGALVPNFSTKTLATTTVGADSVVITDFNHDSKLDVISSSITGSRLFYFANNGNKTFTPYTVFSHRSQVMAIAAADVDGDNYPELLNATIGGVINWFDYVLNFQFGSPTTKQNTSLVKTHTFKPAKNLDPSMGYQWQIHAKRVIPIYKGTLERVTTSSLWTFYTGQSDLVAQSFSIAPSTVERGLPFKITLTETNTGSSNSTSHYTDIWASPDPVITRSGNDIRLARIYCTPIAAKSSSTVTVDVNTGAVGTEGFTIMAVGNYYLGAFVDVLGWDNSESSKDNNKLLPPNTPILSIARRNAASAWDDYR